jgi:NAD kinase
METAPRVVLVTRPSDYQLLIERHGTRGQAEFFLERRGQSLAEAEAMHERLNAALDSVRRAIPVTWRSTSVTRDDLDRFVFEANDLIVVVGQDGLVANLARYLQAQLVVGINPAKESFPGVLVRHEARDIADLLSETVHGKIELEHRTMAEATLEDGQQIVCLNEVFVGHASHQSARYRLSAGERQERQSSSGLIVATGTGATGWASSIHAATGSRLRLPEAVDPVLTFFVREPWASVATGCEIREGEIGRSTEFRVISEMDDRGVIFGDGIEQDFLPFSYGREVTIRPAARTLNLVVG